MASAGVPLGPLAGYGCPLVGGSLMALAPFPSFPPASPSEWPVDRCGILHPERCTPRPRTRRSPSLGGQGVGARVPCGPCGAQHQTARGPHTHEGTCTDADTCCGCAPGPSGATPGTAPAPLHTHSQTCAGGADEAEPTDRHPTGTKGTAHLVVVVPTADPGRGPYPKHSPIHPAPATAPYRYAPQNPALGPGVSPQALADAHGLASLEIWRRFAQVRGPMVGLVVSIKVTAADAALCIRPVRTAALAPVQSLPLAPQVITMGMCMGMVCWPRSPAAAGGGTTCTGGGPPAQHHRYSRASGMQSLGPDGRGNIDTAYDRQGIPKTETSLLAVLPALQL